MEMMKLTGLLVTAALSVTLIGCNGKDGDTGETDTTDTTSEPTDTATTDTTDDPTDTDPTDTTDTDTTDTDTTDTDTDTTDTEFVSPLACDVKAPRGFYGDTDINQALNLIDPESLEFHSALIEAVFDAGPQETCPEISETASGIVGDAGEKGCTTMDGAELSGKMTVDISDDEESFEITYDAFVLEVGEKPDRTSYSANGTVAAENGPSTTTITIDLEETRYLSEDINKKFGLVLGEFISDYVLVVSENEDDSGVFTGEGMVQVIAHEESWTGDFCFVLDLEFLATCEEPEGTIEFAGEHYALTTFNGEEDCDECGTLEIDGEDYGAICL